ncbi:MAG: hypothetical protein U0V03_06720 [Bacteroidia bacterium]
MQTSGQKQKKYLFPFVEQHLPLTSFLELMTFIFNYASSVTMVLAVEAGHEWIKKG